MIFLTLYLILIFLLVFLFYSSFSNTDYISLYTALLPSFITSGYQWFIITNSTVFHYSSFPTIGISWCSQIISNLKLLFLGIYTFSSFNTNLFSIYNLSFLNIFNLAFFICSIALTTSLFFASDFLKFFYNFFLSSLN